MQSDNDSYLATKLGRILDKGIPDSEADMYLGLLEEQTLRFVEMIDGIQVEVTEQLDKAIEVSKQLQRIGVWKD